MTVAATTSSAVPRPSGNPVPALNNGDRLTRAEFERRYRAMPHVNKAELIEGTVYMPSPVRMTCHGQPHSLLIGWLTYYVSKTPGLLVGDNATNRLDEDNEPQPDVMLLIPTSAGGQARVDDDDYVSGPPELVCEVAASSVSIDLHAKLNAYRRNGVREYLVWRVEDQAIDWFALREGRYDPIAPDAAGLVRSGVFPGLWLDRKALLDGDLAGVFAAVDAGCGGGDGERQALMERLRTGG
jgi:Uma2 family endonuclease